MSQAAKWGDLVLGIDIHRVIVPGVAQPVPLPHPFIGVVYDPLGAAISAAIGKLSGGGPVLINGMPVANAGTDIRGRPLHVPLPPGVSFAPDDGLPENKGTLVSGSKTVTMGGASASRLGSSVSSCGWPLNLPTSMCFAIPFGAPVDIGGPDAVDMAAAVTTGIRTKWFSDKAHNILKAKPGSRLSKTICFLTGHPVDVMSGEVLTDAVDFELPGPMPLVFERSYYSRSRIDGPLGPGWSHPLDAWVDEQPERGLVIVRLADGRTRDHEPLDVGASIWDDQDRYTLARDAKGYRLTTWDGWCYWFEPVPGARVTHALVQISDRCDNAIACAYSDGRLAEVIDSAGRRLRFVNEGERLTAIRLQRRREDGWINLARYKHEDGRLSAAIDPKGHALRYAYRGGVLVKETNRNGLSFYFEYDWDDADGSCVHTWGDGGIYERRIQYDEAWHITSVEDGRGGRTLYFGNDAGLVDREIDPMGRETRYEWDEHCRKTAEIDGLGNRKEWAYDARGNTAVERDAMGNETRRRFNELNLPVEIVDATGAVWRREHDDRGRLRAAIDPLGNVTRFEHDGRGNVTAVEDPVGHRTRFVYDERSDLVQTTDAEGGTTRFEHDDLGRVVREADARGGMTELAWDACSRLERLRHSDGGQAWYARDGEGNVIEHIDGLGNLTRCHYAGLNKIVERVDPEGGVLRFQYDTEESLVGVTNEVGETYRIEVDRSGLVVREIAFDGRSLEVLYDAAGYVCEHVDGAGRRTKVERDKTGRIVALRIPTAPPRGKVLPGVEDVRYGWDACGRLIRAKNNTADVLLERDALGRVTRERAGDIAIDLMYDAAGGRVGRRTSLGHEAKYDLDGHGMVVGLRFGFDARFGDFAPDSLRMSDTPVRAPWKATIGRDALGAELARRVPGGIVSRWTRDTAGRPVLHRIQQEDALLAAVSYTWRPELQLASLSDKEGTTRFVHDARSYLVSAILSDGTTQHRAPDAVGNVFRAANRLDRAYGTGGRLLLVEGAELCYDDDGQLVEKRLPDGTRWRYRWDALGQLIEVTRPDGKKVELAYDALGRRVSKTFEGRTTRYAWDGDELVHEVTEGAPLVTWEMDPETLGPAAKVEGQQRYAVLNDHLGTPKAIVDEGGAVAWRGALDVYGAAHVHVMRTTCPWRWPGQYEDEETGLYYNRFRYYDPALGRYISQDPIGLLGGHHLYAYVPDPLAWIDPLGLNCGRRGERIARRHLEGQQYTVLGSIQNRSGHGIDLVARDKKGLLHFFEVKTTNGVTAPALSKAQAKGADWFVKDRLARAAGSAGAWAATHDATIATKADALLNEIRSGVAQGEVIQVALGNGRITTVRW